MRGTLLLAFLLAIPVVASAQDAPVRRFALVVGVSSGGPSRTPLRYATSDARSFAQLLSALGGVADEDRVILVDPNRTRFDVAVADLQTRMRERGNAQRVELIVYYSGHSDEQGLMLGNDQLSYQSFRAALETLPADVRIAIVDSCQSGALTRKKGGTMRPPFLLDTSSKVTGQAILTSSSETEAAQESDRIRGSFFTHYLISGLRGAADVTRDRRVTLNEAYQFAFAETLARTEGTQYGAQHPAYEIQLSGTGDVVMTDLRATPTSLTIDEGLAGRVFLRDKNGVLVAELFKVEGRAVEIGLEPGTYAVRVEKKNEILEGTVEVGASSGTVLRRAGLSEGRAEVVARRGGGETAEAVAVADSRRQVKYPLSLSIIPEIELPVIPEDAVVTKSFSLELVYGLTDHLHGVALSSGVTRAKQSMTGLQLASIGAISNGHTEGAQLSSLFNYAEELHGLQASSLVNIAGDARGMQASIVNVAETFHGFQFSTVNVTAGDTRGFQLALVNVGGDVTGAQLGLVNVGQKVTGTQIGLINVSKEMYGVPFGLVSYVRSAGLGADVGASTSEPLQLALRFNTNGRFFGYLGGGIFAFDHLSKGDAYLGAGFGARLMSLGPVFLEADILVAHASLDFGGGRDDLMVRERLSAVLPMGPLSAFAGISWHEYMGWNDTDNEGAQTSFLASTHQSGDFTFRTWPSIHGGVRF